MLKIKNIILIMLIIIGITMIGNTSYAAADKPITMDSIIDSGDTFIDVGAAETSPIDEKALQDTSDEVYNVLFAIAVVVAIGAGMIIGIQFITGSVEEQAKVKETLVPYVVGVVVIFGAFVIWKVVVNIMQNL